MKPGSVNMLVVSFMSMVFGASVELEGVQSLSMLNRYVNPSTPECCRFGGISEHIL